MTVGGDSVAGGVPAQPLRCAGCNRVFGVGDRYITDTSSGFTNNDADPVVDDLIAGIFGATDSQVRFCENCTEPGGDYLFETFCDSEVEA